MTATEKASPETDVQTLSFEEMRWWYSLTPEEAAEAARDVCKAYSTHSMETIFLNLSAQVVLQRTQDLHAYDLWHSAVVTVMQERINELGTIVDKIDAGLESVLKLAGVAFDSCFDDEVTI